MIDLSYVLVLAGVDAVGGFASRTVTVCALGHRVSSAVMVTSSGMLTNVLKIF